MSRFRNSPEVDGGLGANFGIKATLEEVDSSVLFEFEVREAADPVNVANFKFGTLEAGGEQRSEFEVRGGLPPPFVRAA